MQFGTRHAYAGRPAGRPAKHRPRLLFGTPVDVYRRGMRARALPLGTAASVTFALSLVFLSLSSAPASAQATCGFDAPTAVVTISLTETGSAVIAREDDAITLDGVACGTATVANTDTILVAGPGQGQTDFTIDLAGGPFAPGAAGETDGGDAEIEFTVDVSGGTLHVTGSGEADATTVGTLGINLNAAEAVGDADVTVTGTATIEVLGEDGDDVLSLAGGDGTGSALAGNSLGGGAGDDTLVGAAGGSTFSGGDGADTLDYSAATQVSVDLSAGTGLPTGGTDDTIGTVEDVVGSPGADILVGDDAANVLDGGHGDDSLDGGAGDDSLDGGPGSDTVSFAGSDAAAAVDLTEGTAEGLGTDTLGEIENVEGSTLADTLTGDSSDNVMTGGEGADEIHGREGSDQVTGNRGNDLLFGGDDHDTLDGGKGRDQLNGGNGRDTCIPGPDPDSWSECEKVER
jgi:Ca2+-binding RTX toxin-like protein